MRRRIRVRVSWPWVATVVVACILVPLSPAFGRQFDAAASLYGLQSVAEGCSTLATWRVFPPWGQYAHSCDARGVFLSVDERASDVLKLNFS